MTQSDSDKRVTLAVVGGAHGLRGEVRLKLFTDDLSAYRQFVIGDRVVQLESVRQSGNSVIARFKGVSDRTAAEALRGATLTIARADLPPLGEGEYYHADLIGLPCVTDAGAAIGSVIAVENFGAGDVIEIEKPDGKRFMIPMRAEAVPAWDTQRLVVDAAFVE